MKQNYLNFTPLKILELIKRPLNEKRCNTYLVYFVITFFFPVGVTVINQKVPLKDNIVNMVVINLSDGRAGVMTV